MKVQRGYSLSSTCSYLFFTKPNLWKTASPKILLDCQGFPPQRQRVYKFSKGPGLSLSSLYEKSLFTWFVACKNLFDPVSYSVPCRPGIYYQSGLMSIKEKTTLLKGGRGRWFPHQNLFISATLTINSPRGQVTHCYIRGNGCYFSPNLNNVEITSRWTEEDSILSVWPVQDELIATMYLCNTSSCTTWKARKTGSSTIPLYTPESLEGSFMTRTQSQNRLVAGQEFRTASLGLGQNTTGFNHGQVPLRPPYSWRCPTEQMDSGESAHFPLSLLKSHQLPMLLKPRATEHTLCVLGAWLCHLAWSFRTQAAELAGITSSFKGLFILVLISKECKSD